jgi:RNA polymerase sigma-70 factor (ECF subfamily)
VGDEEFAALYRRHRSALVWHLRCHGASQAEAADAVQDAFAQALRGADQVRDERAWGAWLRTVAVRSYQRSLAAGETLADPPEFAGPDEPAASAELRRQEEFVLALIAGLPRQQRRVFALHYEGWSTAEIGTQLGMDQAAVRQNVARARASLRQWILRDPVMLGEPS